MNHIVFFLEESSAEALLESLLPRLLPTNVRFRCVVFEGKQDLERQLVRRLRSYRAPHARFVVLRDQDSADCHVIKSGLKQKCVEANRPDTVVRIACRELESWYLADLAAVEKGLGVKNLQSLQAKAKYRLPDEIVCPSKTLMRLAPGYQKTGGSRSIAPHLDLKSSRSRSFGLFLKTIRRLAGELGNQTEERR
jgi:hypothetical protein